MEKALIKARDSILAENADMDRVSREKTRHEEDIRNLRQMLIEDLSKESAVRLHEQDLSGRYHFGIGHGIYQAYCLRIDETGRCTAGQHKIGAEKAVEILNALCIQEQADMVIHQYHFSDKKKELCSSILGIINTENEPDQIKKYLRRCLSELIVQEQLIGGISYSFGLGLIVDRPEDLALSLRSALVASCDKILYGSNRIYEAGEADVKRKNVQFSEQYLVRIHSAIEHCSSEEGREAVHLLKDSTTAEMKNENSLSGYDLFSLVCAAYAGFATLLNGYDDAPEKDGFTTAADNISSFDGLFDLLEHAVCRDLEAKQEEVDRTRLRPVRIAENYIRKHYSDPQISLEMISSMAGLSPTYFSVLFKKETGCGFARYLINIRMEEVKNMLKGTNLSISEIAQKTGYHDIKSFNQNFEKTYGVRPSKYRKLYG